MRAARLPVVQLFNFTTGLLLQPAARRPNSGDKLPKPAGESAFQAPCRILDLPTCSFKLFGILFSGFTASHPRSLTGLHPQHRYEICFKTAKPYPLVVFLRLWADKLKRLANCGL